MNPVQITPTSSQDIAEPARGADRVQVALDALKWSNLSPDQVKQLAALLIITVLPTDGTASATKSEAVATFELIEGHQAVVGKITVDGQQLDTLLWEGSFNKTRLTQMAYAKKLGYRMATRKEHLTYVEDLLAKKDNGTINDAEKNALQTYLERYVRDTQGGLTIEFGRVCRIAYSRIGVLDDPCIGALFVHF